MQVQVKVMLLHCNSGISMHNSQARTLWKLYFERVEFERHQQGQTKLEEAKIITFGRKRTELIRLQEEIEFLLQPFSYL